MKEDTDLNLRDALSAKQGEQVWPLNQTDSERKRKTNVCLPTYKEGRERKKENFSQIDKNIPSHSEDNEVTQCSAAVPMTIPSTSNRFWKLQLWSKVESKLLPAKEGKTKGLFFTNPEVQIHLSKFVAANSWPKLVGQEALGAVKFMLWEKTWAEHL